MRKLKYIIPVLLLASQPAFSEEVSTIAAIISGTCNELTVMSIKVKPDVCDGKLSNMNFSNGRAGFYFFVSNEDETSTLISFSGLGSKQVKKSKDFIIQPIDKVASTFQGEADVLDATGSCSFENPYLNKPAIVSCTATTNRGKFSGRFTSDGNEPEIAEF